MQLVQHGASADVWISRAATHGNTYNSHMSRMTLIGAAGASSLMFVYLSHGNTCHSHTLQHAATHVTDKYHVQVLLERRRSCLRSSHTATHVTHTHGNTLQQMSLSNVLYKCPLQMSLTNVPYKCQSQVLLERHRSCLCTPSTLRVRAWVPMSANPSPRGQIQI